MDKKKELIENAMKFIGIYEKYGDNREFSNTEFQELLERTGWKKGWAWCAMFVELILSLTYGWESKQAKTMSPSAQRSFWQLAEKYKTESIPKKGSLVFWSTGIKTGHTGIVTKVLDDGKFLTIEGNQKNKVSVVRRNKYHQRKNWKLLGFIDVDNNK